MKRKRPYVYTVLTVVFALLFSLGSMAGMAMLLKEREGRILAEEGEVREDVPVREWQGNGNVLTMEQIEEAVGCWENRMAMKVHEPVKGQISMEEAIQEGEAWLEEMELDWGEEKSVFATLGAPDQGGSAERVLEPYYSFWWLEFFGKGRRVFLYVNAVAGKVWGAEIYLEQIRPAEMSKGRLRKFVLLSGAAPADAEIAENEGEEKIGYGGRVGHWNLEISHSRLYAREFWFYGEDFLHKGDGGRELVNLQAILQLYLYEEEP